MISFSIKYKIIFRIRSKVNHYTVGFGEKMAKFVLILLVTVYDALATKENNSFNNVLQ